MIAAHNKRLVLNLSSNIVTQIFNKLGPIVIYSFAQSRLTTAGFGYALFAISLLDLSSPFIEAGTTQLGQLEVGRHKTEKSYLSRFLSNLFAVRGISAIVAFFALMICTHYFYSAYLPGVLAGSFLLVTSAMDSTCVQLGTQRLWLLSVFNVTSKILAIGGILAFIRSPEHVLLFVVLMIASNSLYSVATFWNARTLFKLSWPEWRALIPLYRRVAPFALMSLLFYSLEKFDYLLVEYFFKSQFIGLYGGVSRLYISLASLIPALTVAFGSEMLSGKDDAAIARQLRLSLGLTAAIVAPIAAGSWLTGAGLLTMVYDTEYAHLAGVFAILCMALVPQMLVCACGIHALVVKGQVRWVNLSMLLGLLGGVGMAVACADFVSLKVIAVSVVFSKLIICAFILMRAYPLMPPATWILMAKAAVAALAMAASMWLAESLGIKQQSLWWQIIFGAVVYGSCLVILNRQFVCEIAAAIGRKRS